MPWIRRLASWASRWAHSPYFPLAGLVLALGATLTAIAFVPVLCVLVTARGARWGLLVITCALGSALGATILAWIVAEYGPQMIEQWLPRVSHSQQWLSGVHWVEDFGYLALFAFAALPLSQTPVLVACAILGMSLPQIFLAVLAGKLAKYAISAAATEYAAQRVAALKSNAPVNSRR